MKIGIDGRAACWYRGTGIGTYTYQLINSLNNIDNTNNYLIFTPETSNYSPNLNNNFWQEINIPNTLKHSNIDIYHVPQNGVGLPTDKNCRFTITLHDVIPYRMPETVSDRYLKIFSEEIPKIVSLTDSIITVSEFSKKDIIKSFNYPEDKIHVTYLAAEDIYKPLNKTLCKNILKSKYGIDKDFILYLGGFSLRKNILGLIESFSKFISLYKKNISLIIVGKKGVLCEKYMQRAKDLKLENKVIFPGFIPVNDLPYFYNSADLFIYPSFYEGFGLPTIEAMACGTPVITSNTTSIPEVVKDAALLTDPNDIDDMCNCIYKVLSNPDFSKSLSHKGLHRSKKFSWNNCAEDTLNAYKKTLDIK